MNTKQSIEQQDKASKFLGKAALSNIDLSYINTKINFKLNSETSKNSSNARKIRSGLIERKKSDFLQICKYNDDRVMANVTVGVNRTKQSVSIEKAKIARDRRKKGSFRDYDLKLILHKKSKSICVKNFQPVNRANSIFNNVGSINNTYNNNSYQIVNNNNTDQKNLEQKGDDLANGGEESVTNLNETRLNQFNEISMNRKFRKNSLYSAINNRLFPQKRKINCALNREKSQQNLQQNQKQHINKRRNSIDWDEWRKNQKIASKNVKTDKDINDKLVQAKQNRISQKWKEYNGSFQYNKDDDQLRKLAGFKETASQLIFENSQSKKLQQPEIPVQDETEITVEIDQSEIHLDFPKPKITPKKYTIKDLLGITEKPNKQKKDLLNLTSQDFIENIKGTLTDRQDKMTPEKMLTSRQLSTDRMVLADYFMNQQKQQKPTYVNITERDHSRASQIHQQVNRSSFQQNIQKDNFIPKFL